MLPHTHCHWLTHNFQNHCLPLIGWHSLPLILFSHQPRPVHWTCSVATWIVGLSGTNFHSHFVLKIKSVCCATHSMTPLCWGLPSAPPSPHSPPAAGHHGHHQHHCRGRSSGTRSTESEVSGGGMSSWIPPSQSHGRMRWTDISILETVVSTGVPMWKGLLQYFDL